MALNKYHQLCVACCHFSFLPSGMPVRMLQKEFGSVCRTQDIAYLGSCAGYNKARCRSLPESSSIVYMIFLQVSLA